MASLLDSAKDEFKKSTVYSLGLIQTVSSITPTPPQDQIYLIYELAFLRIFLSWESFIEKTFILYMLNEQTDTGYKPDRYVLPVDEKHAHNIVKTERGYFDCSNHETVIRRADLFFKDGEPYKNSLISISSHLTDMKQIRNAIAHISTDSKDKFEKLAIHAFGNLPTGMTPGCFLYSSITGTTKMYINEYKEILENTCDSIVK